MIKLVSEKFDNYLDSLNFKIDNNQISDFLFLGLLGRKRNWKNKCPICIDKETAGTSCECETDHSVMFRSYGHIVCKDHCYSQYVNSRTNKFDEFFSHDSLIHHDFIKLNIYITCPLCRYRVDKAFSPETPRTESII